jgi:hypothetical protein
MVAGPQPPSADAVTEVRVERLLASKTVGIIKDPARVRAIATTAAISATGWSEAGAIDLQPLYRLDLIVRDGNQVTYWIGANSHPPRFPCFSFCSGWWVASSSAPGVMNASSRKRLPESVYVPFLRDLGI